MVLVPILQDMFSGFEFLIVVYSVVWVPVFQYIFSGFVFLTPTNTTGGWVPILQYIVSGMGSLVLLVLLWFGFQSSSIYV